MKIGLILTNDWEIFGDGTGDYFEIQHNPLAELLGLMKEFDARITIMAEVGQQFAHLALSDRLDRAKEISSSWEEILKDAIKSGSDVQLHIHPQWINADFDNGKWLLNMDKWAISSLDGETIETLILKGKSYLETLLKSVKPDYQCIAFRAGAYCIQPSQLIIEKLLKAGIICDTSVTKGLKNEGFYDFSRAHSNILPWICSEKSVTEQGNSGLMEIPIYSRSLLHSKVIEKFLPSLFYKSTFNIKVPKHELEWQKERERVKSIRYPREQRFYKSKQTKNFSFYLKAIAEKTVIQFDYDYLPASVFVKILSDIYKEFEPDMKEDLIIPVVASGHIKDAHSNDNLKWIFENIKKDLPEKVVYWTLSDAINYWYPKLNR
jgi:hypothetical protein